MGGTDSVSRKHKQKVLFLSIGRLHALYNVRLSDKHEHKIQDMCWSDDHLIIDLGYQCVYNLHNNITQSSSMAMYSRMKDMHTF